jgi:DNA-binding NtrC family response regulator
LLTRGARKEGEKLKKLKKRILVVDDTSGIRELFQIVLEAEGHDVFLAIGTNQGMGCLQLYPDIDLVITNRNMPPGMPGENLVRWVKANYHRTKVVLMSIDELEPEVLQIAEAAGVDEIFIGKTVAGLLAVVGRVLSR